MLQSSPRNRSTSGAVEASYESGGGGGAAGGILGMSTSLDASYSPSRSVAALPAPYRSIGDLLSALDLTQYADNFRAEALDDINLLVKMAAREGDLRDSLKEIGVDKVGHREAILSALRPYA